MIFMLNTNQYSRLQKLQSVLRKYGLEIRKETAVLTLDSNLGIEEQSFLIPYNDQKYEFPKENLEFGTL